MLWASDSKAKIGTKALKMQLNCFLRSVPSVYVVQCKWHLRDGIYYVYSESIEGNMILRKVGNLLASDAESYHSRPEF